MSSSPVVVRFRRLAIRHPDRLEPGPPSPPPRTRVRRDRTVPLTLAAALALGLLVGLDPAAVGLLLLAGSVFVALLLRLEWAATAVVVASVFEDYLTRVDPRMVKGLAVLLVLAYVVRRCRGPLHQGARGPVLAMAGAFTVAILLATVVHNNGSTGLAVVLRYAGFLAVLVILSECVRGTLPVQRLAGAYVVACALAAVCGVLTYALGEDRRVCGPVADPNDFAFFLLPAVALAIGLRPRVRRRWLWDLATVTIVVAVLGTLSRGALLGLAAMAVLALGSRMVPWRAAAGLGVVVAGAVALLAASLPGLVSVSLEQKSNVADQNISERLDLWSAAGRMTLERPVLGHGPGSFSLVHGQFMSGLPDDVNHPLDVAHNTWLEISAELGLLGLASFLALVAVSFALAWGAWRPGGEALGAGVAVALVGTAVAATFVTEQYYLPLWLLFALASGVAVPRAEAARTP